MKRFLLCMLLFLSIGIIQAETGTFKTTSYSYKYVNEYGNWTNWSDWEPCEIYVRINYDSDIITIYSNRTQVYKVYSYNGNSKRGTVSNFSVIDQDGDVGSIRIRITGDTQQLYVDFANIAWVYNIE